MKAVTDYFSTHGCRLLASVGSGALDELAVAAAAAAAAARALLSKKLDIEDGNPKVRLTGPKPARLTRKYRESMGARWRSYTFAVQPL